MSDVRGESRTGKVTITDLNEPAKFIKVDSSGKAGVFDDFDDFEAQHVTLSASTDTTITASGAARMVRVLNWDTANRVLVKNGAISSDTDAAASRVGKAPAADVPGSRTIPFTTSTIHLRSASTSEVTVEFYR